MRGITSRSFYCLRLRKKVTLIQTTRWGDRNLTVYRVLSCSDQEACCGQGEQPTEGAYPWNECPACLEFETEE